MEDQMDSISFEYKGKTYTIHRDASQRNLVNGLWEDRAWKTMYHRYSQKLKGKKRGKHEDRKLPKMCEICGGTYTSDWKHAESKKHQLVVKALEFQKERQNI